MCEFHCILTELLAWLVVIYLSSTDIFGVSAIVAGHLVPCFIALYAIFVLFWLIHMYISFILSKGGRYEN